MNEVSPPEDSLSIGGHGNPDFIERKINMGAEEVADALREHSKYTSDIPIYIYSCNAGEGEDSIAERVSDILGNPVFAPPFGINLYSDGTVNPGTVLRISDDEIEFYTIIQRSPITDDKVCEEW